VGPIGPEGPVGATGAPGPAGPIGPVGATGAPGPVGPIGPVGATGAPGPAGPIGPVGATGAPGPVGPIGPIGPAGPVGATGAIGPVGPAGPVGATGAIGPVGPAGPVGATGPAGPAGPGIPTFPIGYIIAGDNAPADFLTGEIVLWPGLSVPPGFFSLEGQVLPIAGNGQLFGIVGTQFGGDGVNNFALPNLVNISPVGRPLNTLPTETDAVTGLLFVEFPAGSGNFIPADEVPNAVVDGGNLDVNDNTVTLQQLALEAAAAEQVQELMFADE
ncbi:tail fiber protein, partial [Dapis sp. BLCC M172]|uniref:phage tail protein n=1 Tax=Dapis sp. BLCC M172 TaxID=2975281 RepID=UPI003CF5608D